MSNINHAASDQTLDSINPTFRTCVFFAKSFELHSEQKMLSASSLYFCTIVYSLDVSADQPMFAVGQVREAGRSASWPRPPGAAKAGPGGSRAPSLDFDRPARILDGTAGRVADPSGCAARPGAANHALPGFTYRL